MKQIVLAILLVAIVVSIITSIFTINQVNNERDRLTSDLQYRSTLLAETLRESVEPNFLNNSEQYLQAIVERFANRERFAGIGLYDNKEHIIAISSSLPKEISSAQKIVADTMDEDAVVADFSKFKDKEMYLLAIPLHSDNRVVGALMVVQNADYINTRITEIWKNNIVRLFTQILLITIALLLILRWILYEPIRLLAESLRLTRAGIVESNAGLNSSSLFLKPLSREISTLKNSLMEARMAAVEEARLGLEKLDSPWTSDRLKEFTKDALKDRKIIVVSNREPYEHNKNGKTIEYHVPASGMVTALEPVMQACGDTWIASGSGTADRDTVDSHDRIRVPPEEPAYTLKRVWLTKQETERYYNGFCNEGLWPLCHNAHTRPIFRKEDWEEYKKVNGKFAQAILSEIKGVQKPIIFIQDFHFALLPRMIKQSRPDATVGLFWHIPWVSSEAFSICPWKKEILRGMLGADLVGFHTQLHCNNFIETVGREMESLINYEQYSISHGDHISFIKPFPISIAFINGVNQEGHTPDAKTSLIYGFGIKTKYIGLGVDRLDYTKGILERFKGVELFLKQHPQYHHEFTFLQIAAPSRSSISKYREFTREVEEEAKRINDEYGTKKWKPIVLIEKLYNHADIQQLYRSADLCLVTSLHDGMNLVAKEFIAARDDQKGVLIVSQFTGAARELKDALIVNPYSGEQTSEAIYTALTMPVSVQTKRMKKLRAVIRNNNIYRWSAEFLKTIISIES